MMSHTNAAHLVEMQQEGFSRCSVKIRDYVRVGFYEGYELLLLLQYLLKVLVVILGVLLLFELLNDLVL